MPNNKTPLILAITLIGVIVWNYWLPSALIYLNNRKPSEPHFNMDFYAYYTAGKSFGLGLDPYRDNGGELSDPNNLNNGYSRYIYPPTMLPFYSLLGHLDYDLARIIWAIGYLYVHLVVLLAIAFQSRTMRRGMVVLLGLLLTITSQPLLYHLRQGQINLLIMGLVVASFLVQEANHKFLSAFLLVLATVIKVNPVVFLITFVVYKRDLQYLMYFLSILIGLTLGSMLLVPPVLYREYLLVVLPSLFNASSFYFNQSLIRLIPSINNLPQLVAFAGFSSFALYAWIVGRRHSTTPNERSLYAKGMLFMNSLAILLFSSLSWEMTYVWIILPATLFLSDLIPFTRVWFIGCVGVAIALLNSNILPAPVLDSLNVIGGFFLIICLGILLWKPRVAIFLPPEKKLEAAVDMRSQ